tara:strand:+ start:1257 stop:1868 length:612 start_codon:yes stop_codon:yes gene_type:complete
VNWIDFILIGISLTSFIIGWRTGLLGAIFNTLGIIFGIILAGRFSDDIADLITGISKSDTVAIVISYAVIMVGTFLVAQLIKGYVKKVLSIFFMGWIDSAGGIVLGILAGSIVCGAILTTLARFSTDVTTVSNGDSLTTLLIESQRSGLQESIHNSLLESTLVPIYVDVVLALPENALDVVPAEFRLVMEALDKDINNIEKPK